ncbi:unnamed protein product [Malus baccata var. baccata]
MELSDVMRWTGDPPKYSNPEKCTLALNHGGYLMDGAYIGGQVCYLDHVTADYLSLLEFRKIGKYVGYDENDLFSGKVQIHYRVPGTFEEIVADSTIVTLIGKIPPNRFVEIFYWPTLDDDEFNLDGFGEIGINQETETDKGEQNEENDDDFVDTHYPPPPTNLLGEHNDTPQPQRLRKWFVEIACVGCGKSQHTNATNKNQETQQVNTQATNQNAQANSQTSGTQMSQGNTETRAPINSQGKQKRGGYKGMGNQARPWRL